MELKCDPYGISLPLMQVFGGRDPDGQVYVHLPRGWEDHLDKVPFTCRSLTIRGGRGDHLVRQREGRSYSQISKNVHPPFSSIWLRASCSTLQDGKSSSRQSIEGRGTDTATPIAATTAERGFRSNSVCGLESGALVHFPVTGFRAERNEPTDKTSPQARASQEGQNRMATCQIHKLARGAWGDKFRSRRLQQCPCLAERNCWRGSWVREGRWRTGGTGDCGGIGVRGGPASSEKVPGRMFQ
ncbi:hypothetical protein B0T18DRAFT_31618 [Schizothecium vesticola]|uniref:Uncharacterized protein n=1 Tax=Schizothecium vesticola TaxID=314040 RepID=A0AA40FAM2_9PEZI|nr:hypothetical protein B0T18DRAFT_31618 [Schizothecium vesticola]